MSEYCGCTYRYWDNPITGEGESVKTVCEMHDEKNPAARYLNASMCWHSDGVAGSTSHRYIGGYMEGLLHGLYRTLKENSLKGKP